MCKLVPCKLASFMLVAGKILVSKLVPCKLALSKLYAGKLLAC